MSGQTRSRLMSIAPLMIVLVMWLVAVRLDPRLSFFIGSPTKTGRYLFDRILDLSLLRDAFVTLNEAVFGFLLGSVVGTTVGLLLWYSRTVFQIARPYVLALGSAPIIALAPLIIIWFGTGFLSKVMTAAFSTVFVALLQAYSGASDVQRELIRLFNAFRATKLQIFRKLVIPSALSWVIAGLRLNIGFALLGAFVGEFISSSNGLGHLILVASGLFDISLVLVGLLSFVGIALFLNWVLAICEPSLRRLVARNF